MEKPVPVPQTDGPHLPQAIVTPHLTLRRWQVADAATLHEAVTASIEHLRPWMEWIKFEPLTVPARADLIRSWAEEDDHIYGIFLGPIAVGGCGLHRRVGPNGLEIGYWIHADHVRQGYATEAARALTETALAADGIGRVEIHHDKANVPSGAVPRSLGYTLVGEFENEIKAPAETGVSLVWRISDLDDLETNASAPSEPGP